MNFMNRNIKATVTFFAPQLTLRNVLAGMAYYQRAFGAIELRRWSNPDGSVHVAEMAIEGVRIVALCDPDIAGAVPSLFSLAID